MFSLYLSQLIDYVSRRPTSFTSKPIYLEITLTLSREFQHFSKYGFVFLHRSLSTFIAEIQRVMTPLQILVYCLAFWATGFFQRTLQVFMYTIKLDCLAISLSYIYIISKIL